MNYSVLMSTYAKDRPDWLIVAVESMANQTLKPAEIIIMIDGPIPEELQQAVSECVERYPIIRTVAMPENVGLGEAMRLGINECKNEWIARMDADDISDIKRCEEELRFAIEKNADIVGCDCAEFTNDMNSPKSMRVFPEDHESLVELSRRKVPFCHPAVMMKKSAVLRAGNYKQVFLHEDYDVFVRMLATGSVGCTVKKTLYHVRVNENFYNRRGGIKYVMTLLGFNWSLLRRGWMSPADFFVRSCGNILVGMSPTWLRMWIYRRFLRK